MEPRQAFRTAVRVASFLSSRRAASKWEAATYKIVRLGSESTRQLSTTTRLLSRPAWPTSLPPRPRPQQSTASASSTDTTTTTTTTSSPSAAQNPPIQWPVLSPSSQSSSGQQQKLQIPWLNPRAKTFNSKYNSLQRLGMPAGGYDLGHEIPKAIDQQMHVGELMQRHNRKAEARIRLSPSLGRTVYVLPNVDAPRAVLYVNGLCKANRVFVDMRSQMFHERPGLRRKRLKSMRWRARFKVGFEATVNRVKELHKQGW